MKNLKDSTTRKTAPASENFTELKRSVKENKNTSGFIQYCKSKVKKTQRNTENSEPA